MQRRAWIVVAVVIVAAVASVLAYEAVTSSAPSDPCSGVSTTTSGPAAPTVDPILLTRASSPSPSRSVREAAQDLPENSTEVIPVVAAENFWGSLVAQLGGTHVNVTSIVTDPNEDPHEYQANESTAIAITNARYVILNNVGYDQWATQIVDADGNTNQTVLNVGDMLGVSVYGGIVTGNPHLWYNPTYVNETVAWMFHNLTTIAPSLEPYFNSQYALLNSSLGSTYAWVTQIKDHFAGTEVASTESIFVYLANSTDLDLVSPPAFMEAVAEGNDPPDSSVVEFQCQLESGHVRVLVYNAQTVTPLTTNMKTIAQENNVTVVAFTETIQPPSASYETWMTGQLLGLYNALNANALGQ